MANKVYEIVTKKIIKRLKNGDPVWKKGWMGKKINYVSRNSYHGINLLLLERPGEYLTWNQIQKLEGKVKKGSKSEMIIYYKQIKTTKKEKNENGKLEEKKITIPLLRYYRVFHIDDTTGIPSKLEKARQHNPIKEAENIINNYINKPKIEEKASSRAFYNSSKDKAVIPKKSQFKDINEYYSVFFHELSHSTGHKKRLNRFTNKDQFIFSSESYSKEELVAEISAAMLCSIAGIETKETINNTAGYINSWVKKLENDYRLIISASSKAQQAVDLITKKAKENEKTA